MNQPQGYISVTVPVQLLGSHGQTRPGFSSRRRGELVTWVTNPAPGTDPFVKHFAATDLTVLGIPVSRFSVGLPTGDGGAQELVTDFVAEQTEDTITVFLKRLTDALSASFAADQQDPWYGNLVLEVGWAGMRLERQPTPGILQVDVRGSVAMTSIEARPLTPQLLETLADTALIELFVEGMRVNRPRAKYAAWFIMVEEFERLAVSPEFIGCFEPLFPTDLVRERVAEASGLTGTALQRLRQFLDDPRHTVQPRAEKLLMLLRNVGMTTLPALGGGTKPIDLALCKRLINQRNAVAHKGRKIDEDLLYTVLFPLSLRLLNYLHARGTGSASPMPPPPMGPPP